MAIFSDLELQRIMNEASDKKEEWKKVPHKDELSLMSRRATEAKGIINSTKKNIKDNSWIGKKKSGNAKSSKKVKFKEDKDGNVIECTIDDYEDNEYLEEGLINKKTMNKLDDVKTDLTNKSTVAIEKEKQDWGEHPGAKTGELIGDIATGGNFVNSTAKKAGRFLGGSVDKIIHAQEKKRKLAKEDTDWRHIHRSQEYARAMNEFFDITDTETRKVLLAVNEADQNKVLVSLTSKLYDNVVDRVDDIDFGEIERSKGDIEKLPNFETLHECLNNMARLLIEFKQDTKPVDTIAESISDIIESKGIWTKAYAINAELPIITYNTITLAIIEATSYMVSMCVDFVKSPSQDTMQIMIDKSALTKSKGHLLFKNLESFNDAYRKGQVEKAMTHVLDEAMSKKTIDSSRKNFIGGIGFYTGGAAVAAVVGVAGLLFCIIPIIRELIFLFFYYRVKISDFFEVQADLLQVNSYNVQNNRLDLTKEERKKISAKQMKVADDFRKISRKIAVDGSQAEKSASKDIKAEDNKKYKASEIMDELPDSAASSLF